MADQIDRAFQGVSINDNFNLIVVDDLTDWTACQGFGTNMTDARACGHT